MKKLFSRFTNWKTTGGGVAIAVLQVANQLSNEKDFDWKPYAVALAIVLLGGLAGDKDKKG